MHSPDLRNAAVHLYLNHQRSLRRTAAMLGGAFGKSTLQRWVTHHPVLQRARQRHESQRSRAHVAARAAIRSALLTNPFLTATELAAEAARHSAHIRPCTASRWRHAMGFTRKRTYSRAPDTERIATARAAFVQCHGSGKLPMEDVVSVDETCLYVDPPPRSGYAPRGQRLRVPLHARRQAKFTLLLAVAASGVVAWELLPGSADRHSFAAFVSGLPPDCPRHVLMDNLSVHKCAEVRAALAARGLEPVFTPPYSPEFNPVEMAFSVLKRRLRRERPVTQEGGRALEADMCARVGFCLATIAASSLRAMFSHVWRTQLAL